MDPDERGLWSRIRRFLEPESGAETAALIGTSMVPGVGTAVDAADLAASIQDRDPLRGGIAAAGLALPFVSAAQLKAMGRGIGSFVDRFKRTPTTMAKNLPAETMGNIGLRSSPIETFHGARRDFDEFDITEIGRGYGHSKKEIGSGHFTAQREPLGQFYRNQMSGARMVSESGDILRPLGLGGKAGELSDHMAEVISHGGDPADVINRARRVADEELTAVSDRLREMGIDPLAEPRPQGLSLVARADDWAEQTRGRVPWAQQSDRYPAAVAGRQQNAMIGEVEDWLSVQHWLDTLDPQDIRTIAGGKLYDVGIHADPEKFINWDLPLGEQSKFVRDLDLFPSSTESLGHMQDALLGRGVGVQREGIMGLAPQYGGNQREISRALHGQGVPGIRFQDIVPSLPRSGQDSYMTFHGDLLEILKKRAQGGLV